jgi:hypothetical protein
VAYAVERDVKTHLLERRPAVERKYRIAAFFARRPNRTLASFHPKISKRYYLIQEDTKI